MSSWTPILLPALVTAAWLWVPGLLAGSALRLRPCVLWALAPLISVAVIALAAIAAPLAGRAWGPLPAGVLALALAIVLWAPRLIRRPARRRPLDTPDAPVTVQRSLWSSLTGVEPLTAAAIAGGGLLLGRQVLDVLSSPHALSQSFDNIFHQSAVRYILDGGSPSSRDLLAFTATPGDPTFYPAAWHDIVSLVLATTGSEDIPLATNALILVTCAMVWPAGIVLLSRFALPTALVRGGLLPAGALAAAVPQFPLHFVDFGVLYPNLLGMALLPALLALVLRFLGLARREGIDMTAVLVVGLLGAISVSLAHPNTSMAVVALLIPLSFAAALRSVARAADRRSPGTWKAAGLLVALSLVSVIVARTVWPLVRPPEEAATWPPIMSVPESVGQAVTMSASQSDVPWPLVVMLLLGSYAAVRRRRPELLLAFLAVAYLWVAIAAWPEGEERTALVGVWYNDPQRLPPLLAVIAIPLMALGVAHLVRAIGTRWVRLRWHATWCVTLVLLILTQGSGWLGAAVGEAEAGYAIDDTSQLLTSDEMALILEIPELVPEDAVIVTNSWNGSSLAYPYTGIATTTHHTLEYVSPEDELLAEHLREASGEPEVCAALEEQGADYVLDFGTQNINDSPWQFPGLADLEDAEGFTEIAAHGDAVLYRIDACGP